jgi:DNA-binding NarL/FixJ family response regulator
MAATHRVGILEDHPDFNRLLRRLVESDPSLSLAFCESLLDRAMAAIKAELDVDLLLVDLQLPDGSGLDLVRAAAAGGQARILVLTVLADRASVFEALELGAHGYVLKDAPISQIRSAIASVLAGDSPLSPSVAAHVVAAINRPPAGGPGVSVKPGKPREVEVIAMMAKGLSYREIADVLGLSVHTVGDHVKSAYRKLGARSRTEAIFEARIAGWISRLD